MSQHDLSRTSDRLTHQQRLARVIKEISGVGYQRSLELIIEAANDGRLTGRSTPKACSGR